MVILWLKICRNNYIRLKIFRTATFYLKYVKYKIFSKKFITVISDLKLCKIVIIWLKIFRNSYILVKIFRIATFWLNIFNITIFWLKYLEQLYFG